MAHVAQGAASDVALISDDSRQLTETKIQQLLRLLDSFKPNLVAKPLEGTIVGNYAWILNSGASEHMMGKLAFFNQRNTNP